MEYVFIALLLFLFGVLCFRIDVKHRIINELLKNSPKHEQIANEISQCESCYMFLAIITVFLIVICMKL